MTGGCFALAGVAVGVVQAGLLVRSLSGHPGPRLLLARLFIVAVVLLLAARAEHLAAGAGGWAVGFVLAAAMILRGLR